MGMEHRSDAIRFKASIQGISMPHSFPSSRPMDRPYIKQRNPELMQAIFTRGFFLGLLGLFFANAAQAQCAPSIPPYASQENGTVLFGVSGDTVWLCPGSQLDLESSFGSVDNVVVYAEENSLVRLEESDGNDGNLIHIQNGGQVEIGSNATNTTVHHASSVTINDNGSGTTTNDCGSVTFDYSNAPPDDCNAQSLSPAGSLASEAEVYSSGERVHVEVPSGLLAESGRLRIHLYDMLGKEVHAQPIHRTDRTMNPDLRAGVYLYTIRLEGRALKSGKLGLQ